MEAATLQQNSRRDWITPAELIALGAIWGGSFLFMRVAAGDFGPIALVEVRVVLGALSLMPFLWRVRRSIGASLWLRLAIVGLMNSAIPFTLFAWGAERAPAGVGAIANSMTPLFTALVAFAVWREAISMRRAVALVVGLIGVVVLASDRVSGANVTQAAVAGTVASLSYGFAANLTKRWLYVIPPAAAVAGTQLCSALMLAPLAFFNWPTSQRSAAIVACRRGTRCSLHRYRLCVAVPAHRSRGRCARHHVHVSHSRIRRRLGVVVSGRSADADHGHRRHRDSGQRDRQPARNRTSLIGAALISDS